MEISFYTKYDIEIFCYVVIIIFFTRLVWNFSLLSPLKKSKHKLLCSCKISECEKWAHKSCSNLHVKWGWDSVTRSVKAARKLTSPRPRIKSSTDDFVLSRSFNFGSSTRPASPVSSANLWSIAWRYATPCAEIGPHRHIHATQRDKHRKYRWHAWAGFRLRGVQS